MTEVSLNKMAHTLFHEGLLTSEEFASRDEKKLRDRWAIFNTTKQLSASEVEARQRSSER